MKALSSFRRALLILSVFPIAAFAEAPVIEFNGISDDPDYGYQADNPIKIGGFNTVGPCRMYAYIGSLTGPNGEEIFFQRAGSCCPFDTPNAIAPNLSTSGLLDIVRIKYEGIPEPVTLYFNTYDSDTVKAPKGLGHR